MPEGTEHTVTVRHPGSYGGEDQEKKILVPKGLTECEPVIKITDNSRYQFEKLAQVLQNVQQDKQVLIVLSNLLSAQKKQFKEKMPKDKFLVYLSLPSEEMPNDDISEIKAWMTEEPSEKKFLLCDQYTAGGYEFASVILATEYLQSTWTSNMCQRAKAKLIVYEIPQ